MPETCTNTLRAAAFAQVALTLTSVTTSVPRLRQRDLVCKDLSAMRAGAAIARSPKGRGPDTGSLWPTRVCANRMSQNGVSDQMAPGFRPAIVCRRRVLTQTVPPLVAQVALTLISVTTLCG